MLNGKYVNGFEPSFKDLFFVGLNDAGKLIGGKFSNQADLDRLKPRFGATFVAGSAEKRAADADSGKMENVPVPCAAYLDRKL